MNSAIAEPDGRLASWEANHRSLNTLAALQGLLWTEFERFADPAVRQAVSDFSSHIQAFARVHHTLSEATADGPVDATAHLAKLCAELCAAQLAPRGLHCDFRADPGTLPREVCHTLGLIVVELVTSAATHGFVGRETGRIRVSLRRTGLGWMCMVADNGSGLQGGGGDGMTLVQGLAKAIDGDLRVHSDAGGVVVTVSLLDTAFARTAQAAAGPWHA
ncbi:MAG: histidine kinase [Phenylobacterium sp.]|nr:histidine kinase [Phenylobacterium sp.]